jgi:predicted Rossmann fold flavoprotein
MKKTIRVGIIGGGAAGYFSAISAKAHFPNSEVTIFEKSAKVLAKVKISGGGRCNVTNACFDNKELSSFYPRGGSFLRKAFEQFNSKSTMDWFENRNVPLDVLAENCVFPKSNQSQSIIDCFVEEAKTKNIEVKIQTGIVAIEIQKNGSFILKSGQGDFEVDKVIVTTGGHPKRESLVWLEKIGHSIVNPLPSLFTFNMPKNPVCALMGNVVDETTVKIEGTKLTASGPLLVTHWGMSGPAILKLSAWGARDLAAKGYQFSILVNWLNDQKEEKLRTTMNKIIEQHGMKMIGNLNPFKMTSRLWNFLLEKTNINPEKRWNEVGKKSINKLINTLLNDRYDVAGKTTFKEEFVTAGGISLEKVDVMTMQSRVVPGLFFAGEVLDIDGVTGGFSFQAAWTTGWIAGKNCCN